MTSIFAVLGWPVGALFKVARSCDRQLHVVVYINFNKCLLGWLLEAIGLMCDSGCRKGKRFSDCEMLFLVC